MESTLGPGHPLITLQAIQTILGVTSLDTPEVSQNLFVFVVLRVGLSRPLCLHAHEWGSEAFDGLVPIKTDAIVQLRAASYYHGP